MSKSKHQAIVDSMAEEYRADAIVRLKAIDQTLTKFQANEDRVLADFTTILEQIHSIKGTAKTFGFHALSHVSHAINDWMCEIAHDNPTAIDMHDPALGEDLQLFLSLMLKVTRIEVQESEQQGIDALSQTAFTLYPGGAAKS